MSGMTKAKSSMGLQFSLVAGDTAATDIPVTGIATSDSIIFVGMFASAVSIATLADDTANVTIYSAGNIRSATDTSSNHLLVVWNDNSL